MPSAEYAEQISHLTTHDRLVAITRSVIEEAAEVLSSYIEGGDGGEDHRAHVEEAAHVLHVDHAVRGLAEAQDEEEAARLCGTISALVRRELG